jgi:hypothetical protein
VALVFPIIDNAGEQKEKKYNAPLPSRRLKTQIAADILGISVRVTLTNFLEVQ